MGAKIKKGDEVIVISGASRGEHGRVLRVDRSRERVYVEGVNMITKTVRAGQSKQGATEGGFRQIEGPIHISNVAIYEPKAAKGDKKIASTRVGFREEQVERDGRLRTVRIRYAKATGKDID